MDGEHSLLDALLMSAMENIEFDSPKVKIGMRSTRPQPNTWRMRRLKTTARYSQPSRVGIYVIKPPE